MPKILIIDDERGIRSTLKEILEYENYTVDQAEDGEKGLEALAKTKYDVVLCDIKMPKMDGLEVLEQARESNPDVPFIMVSAHGTIDTAVEATKKGAYDFLVKPPDLNRLLVSVRNALDKSNLVTGLVVCQAGTKQLGNHFLSPKGYHFIKKGFREAAD